MKEQLYNLDIFLFELINVKLSNVFFDLIMPLFHYKFFFLPMILIPWIIGVYFDKTNRWKLLILIPISIIFVDQTGLLIKTSILRPRPWSVMDMAIFNHLVSKSGTNLSFPSNHAANITVLAIIFSSIYIKYKTYFKLTAIIVIFSRVYIGVHYPSDVIAGTIIGFIYATILLKVWDNIMKYKKIN